MLSTISFSSSLKFHDRARSAALRGLLASSTLLIGACQVKDGVLTDYVATDGTTTTLGNTDSTTEITATTTSATGEPELCEDPSLPVPGPEVQVTVRNNGAADIFVLGNGFCGDPAYSLFDAEDNQLITWIGAECPPPCDRVFESGECGCLDIGCPGGVIRIVPGGAFVDTWDGARFDIVQPPAECVPEVCVGQSCSARVPAEPGSYTIAAHGNSTFVCEIGDCACEPNAEGWCKVPDAAFEPGTVVEAPLTYPDDAAVELVFE